MKYSKTRVSMKSLFILIGFLSVNLVWSQSSEFPFKTTRKNAIIIQNSDTIFYVSKTDRRYDLNNNEMRKNTFVFKNDTITFKNNTLHIAGSRFKFKRPIFGSKTYVKNLDTKRPVITFNTDYESETLSIEQNVSSRDYDQEVLDVLMKWSFFHQVEYIHMNRKESYDIIDILIPVVAAGIATQ